MTRSRHLNMLLAFAPSIADEAVCEVLNRCLPFKKGTPEEELVTRRVESACNFEQRVDLLDEILTGEGQIESFIFLKKFSYPADIVVTARVEMAKVAQNIEKHIIHATRKTEADLAPTRTYVEPMEYVDSGFHIVKGGLSEKH